MKLCPRCGMRFDEDHLFCPWDGTLLLRDVIQPELGDGPETDIFVFCPLPDTAPWDPGEPEGFDPSSETGAWFTEGEEAERELACATASRPLPAVYSRGLEKDGGSPSPLRGIPWVIGAGIAGIAVMLLALLV